MVPEGWTTRNLGELITYKKGFAFTSADYSNSGVRIIRISDTTRDSVHSENPVYIPDEVATKLDAHLLSSGDILLTTVGSRPHLIDSMVGKVIRVPPTVSGSLLNQNLVKLIPHEEEITTEYLFEILKKPKFRHYISTLVRGNANQVSISLSDLFKYRILIPELREQKKIAQILSTWDKAITTTEQLLANSQQQKKALMQQLLTGKKRLLDENGVRFSGEWKTVHLGDICTLNPKKTTEPEGSQVSFVGMDSVSEDARLIYTTTKHYNEVSKGFTSFKNNDVLVAKITPCFENGKGAYVYGLVNGIGFGSTEFHVLRATERSNSKYLYYLTNTAEFRIRGEANMQGSAGQKRVSTDYLKTFKVKVPPSLKEQAKMAELLWQRDKELSILEVKLGKLKQEKKALMQQLLTGKRRVKIED